MTDLSERNRIISFILNSASADDLRHIVNAYEVRVKTKREARDPDTLKIPGRSDLNRVIDSLLRIDKDELVFVRASLERRMESKKRYDPISGDPVLGKMAKEQATGLQRRMDDLLKSVHGSSRKIVAEMILQYDPFIPEEHLYILLDKWAPSADAKKKGAPVPYDVMLAMIEQFLSYSLGEMGEDDLKEFPNGWAKKYWEAFSQDLQKLIASYLHNEIDKNTFWHEVNNILKG